MTARSWKVVVLLMFALPLAACAGTLMKNYGSFQPDAGITREFETYQLRPDVHYFFSGSDVWPNAILALNRQYTLENPLWRGVNMTPEKLKDFVTAMQQRSRDFGLDLQGFAVRDATGHEIGVWYSVLFATTSVKVEGDKATILTPPQHVYPDEGRDRDVRD